MMLYRPLMTTRLKMLTAFLFIATACATNNPAGPQSTLAGIVTDVVSGSPVSGVTVAAEAKTATTGADGKYSLSGLTNGAATVTAQHQGHVNFSQAVTISGTTSQNIALTPSNAAKMAGA